MADENEVRLQIVGEDCWGAMSAPTVVLKIQLDGPQGSLSKIVNLNDLEAMIKKATSEAIEKY